MPKLKFGVLINPYRAAITTRLGSGTKTAAGHFVDDLEVNKFVKFVADSRYDLCVAGDQIEAQLVSMEGGTVDDYSWGSVRVPARGDRIAVVLDGLQATPGTGAIAIGDYVVVGTVVAKGTALAAAPKVTKSTIQPGVTEGTVVGDINDHVKAGMNAFRLVSASGTAVGSTGIIERV